MDFILAIIIIEIVKFILFILILRVLVLFYFDNVFDKILKNHEDIINNLSQVNTSKKD